MVFSIFLFPIISILLQLSNLRGVARGTNNSWSFAKDFIQSSGIPTGAVNPDFAASMTITVLFNSLKTCKRYHFPYLSLQQKRNIQIGSGKFNMSSLQLLIYQLMNSLQFLLHRGHCSTQMGRYDFHVFGLGHMDYSEQHELKMTQSHPIF